MSEFENNLNKKISEMKVHNLIQEFEKKIMAVILEKEDKIKENIQDAENKLNIKMDNLNLLFGEKNRFVKTVTTEL